MDSFESSRLNRLLAYIRQDAANLALRKDAIREACDTGHWVIARTLIDAGLHAHPKEAELLAHSGFAYLQAQRYGDAEQVLSAALSQGLDVPELHYNLAFAQFMQKRFADALERLAAPGLSQALPLALLLRARCLHHVGFPTEAIADCQALLGVMPDDAAANGLLALLLYEQGQTETAAVHVGRALQQNSTQLEALLTAASVQSDSQDYGAARATFEMLLHAYPECGRAWLGLGLIELHEQKLDAAERHIELAATHMPEHIGTWHVVAWVQIMRGNVLAAEVAFHRALALDRNFSETHGGLAVIAALQGLQLDARTSIKRALRLDPQSMSAQYAQMLLLNSQGDHDEAQAIFDGFLSRPVPRSDMQYRDLVAAHIKYLRTATERVPQGAVRH